VSVREVTVRRDAPAKINLYLEVRGRRDDGFQEIVTVLQTIDLRDHLTVGVGPPRGERPRVTLEVGGPAAAGVPAGADNLVTRAARALLGHAGARADVHVVLDKHVPAAGGLGGGSSDAAATLAALDEALGLGLGPEGLTPLAAALGSDVPFFLHGGTALCTGRGERVRPLAPPRPFPATLVLPGVHLPTPRVYRALGAGTNPVRIGLDELAARVAGADCATLEALFRNDLEAAASRVEPRLAAFLAHDALHLSGSGSTLFAFGPVTARLSALSQGKSICEVRSYTP